MTNEAFESLHRLREWGETAGVEVVEVAMSVEGLAGGERRIKMRGSATPPGRVGAGVGWTVALPSGRHYGALREVVAAYDPAESTDADLDRVRGLIIDVAEAEVADELATVSDWRIDSGASVRHYTEQDFYTALDADVQAAQSSILVLAPFLGHRLAELVAPLAAAVERDVEVTLLVRPEYAARPKMAGYLADLRAGGVRVVERNNRVHEKVVVVDRTIAYHGSLNPLSHKFTHESMMRFECPPIAEGFHLLYHPDAGQSFAERVAIDVLPGGGRAESRIAWGDPPLWWKAGLR